MTLSIIDEKKIDKILGTPSSQSVMRLLAIWENLIVKQIQNKTNLSESQVHITLKRLLSIRIIEKVSKGIYRFNSEKFAQSLKKAYVDGAILRINELIYEIGALIKKRESEKANLLYKNLISNYDPLLKQNFSHLMSSLSHQFLEMYEDR